MDNLLAQSPGLIAIIVLLTIGTVARITRLITADSIMEPVRAWIERKATAKVGRKVWTWLDDLVVCPWCVGWWCSMVVAYVVVWHWDNRFIFAGMVACTASWIAANVQMREPE